MTPIATGIYDIERAIFDLRCREAARQVVGTRKTASLNLDPEVLAAFGEFLWVPEGRVAFGGLIKKFTKLFKVFQRAPKLLEKIKAMIGDLTPQNIKDWAKSGKQALRTLGKKLMSSFPLALFFVPNNKAPGLTDLLDRMKEKVPWVADAFRKVKDNVVDPLDRLFDKYIPNLKRPIVAAIFIYVWLNVAELSWDMEFLLRGFTGALSLGELFGSFPESAIGFVAASMGLGFHALPITIIARIVWLVANRYLEWHPGKGFTVRWDLLGLEEKPERVAIA